MSTTEERHQARLAVYLILRKDDQVLCIRRANTGYRDGFYGLPSGHIEPNEPAIMALVREAKEEVGVRVDPSDLSFVHVVHRISEEGGFQYVDFFFETTKWEGEPTNQEPEKCDDVRWFPEAKLPDTMIPIIRTTLQAIADGVTYSDDGFST